MRSTTSTPARFSPSSVVSRWIGAQPLEIRVRVEPRVAGRPLRTHQPLLLVDAERLRVHADQVGGDADHVARRVVHHIAGPLELLDSSRCFFVSFFGTVEAHAREQVALPAALQLRRARGP